MKAAVVGEHGVEVRDLPKPEPKPNEVLIRVRASSLNRADLLVSQGHQHGAVGGVGARLGLECAGEVEAVGSEVQHVKAGDRVMGSAPGGYAEYAVTDGARVHRIPANNMTPAQPGSGNCTTSNAWSTNAGPTAAAEMLTDVEAATKS